MLSESKHNLNIKRSASTRAFHTQGSIHNQAKYEAGSSPGEGMWWATEGLISTHLLVGTATAKTYTLLWFSWPVEENLSCDSSKLSMYILTDYEVCNLTASYFCTWLILQGCSNPAWYVFLSCVATYSYFLSSNAIKITDTENYKSVSYQFRWKTEICRNMTSNKEIHSEMLQRLASWKKSSCSHHYEN